MKKILTMIETSWMRAVERCGQSCEDISLRDAEAVAREQVERTVFLNTCHTRGLLPDLSANQPFSSMVNRLGSALFQLHPDSTAEPSGHACASEVASLNTSELAGLDCSPEMLGRIHHRLLCLRAKPGENHQARMSPSRSAVRSRGVYYTPECVARYMTAGALESLENDRTASEVRPPRVIDPACGCGAFLVAAYRQLVLSHDRQQILNQLHGIDLDEQAVLTARRALWLAAADSPAGPPSPEQTEIFFKTIRPGNALGDPAVDLSAQSFDLVLGNPPYRRELGAKGLLEAIAQTDFGWRWRTARMDLWYYFAHRALELLRDGGILSFIVSGYWTAGTGSEKLIDQLSRETRIEEIFDLDRLEVFEQVAGRHLIFRAKKTHDSSATTLIKRPQSPHGESVKPFLSGKSPLMIFTKRSDDLFRDRRIDLEPVDHGLLDAIAQGVPLGLLGRVRQGIAENPATINRRTNHHHGEPWTVGEGVFVLTPVEVKSLGFDEHEMALFRPYHQLCDLGRYCLAETASRMLLYSTPQTCPDIRDFPAIHRHLARFRPILDARRETRLGRRPWWQLHWPREPSLWTAERKVFSIQMARRPAFVAAMRPVWVNFSVNCFVPDPSIREHPNYFAALLNSELLWSWFRHHAKRRGVGLEINGRILAQTPIRRIDFAVAHDRRHHDELADLVRQRMQSDRDSETIEQRIDAIVRRLYGLSSTSQIPQQSM